MSLEIVVGPMFSGKSTHILSYVRRQKSIGKSVVAIKPNIDSRYSDDNTIVTHDKDSIPCIIWDISKPLSISTEIAVSQCVVIEEAQFFKGLYEFVRYMMHAFPKEILIVGLDGDANQVMFGEVLMCIPWATKITKLNAFCVRCKDGTFAPFTRKKQYDNIQIDVGSSDKYEAVCIKHLY